MGDGGWGMGVRLLLGLRELQYVGDSSSSSSSSSSGRKTGLLAKGIDVCMYGDGLRAIFMVNVPLRPQHDCDSCLHAWRRLLTGCLFLCRVRAPSTFASVRRGGGRGGGGTDLNVTGLAVSHDLAAESVLSAAGCVTVLVPSHTVCSACRLSPTHPASRIPLTYFVCR
jgi:hypothetical protein